MNLLNSTKGKRQTVYAGWLPGKVYVACGDSVIALTPKGARVLAAQLPGMIVQAERGGTPDVPTMATVLAQRGWKWLTTNAARQIGYWQAPGAEQPLQEIFCGTFDFATLTAFNAQEIDPGGEDEAEPQ